jgi:SAM-dependent methyltransferase
VRVRLRPAYSPEQLTALYPKPHDHTRWPDHLIRVDATIDLARDMGVPEIVADLSCGDAAIGRALAPSGRLFLGDFAPGYEYQGPIEETLDFLEHVGMFICSETVEHLDDPDAVLAAIRKKADALVLSTPLGEFTDINPEHYWGWDVAGVGEMLTAAGWAAEIQRDVITPWASYQLWGCR